MSATYHTPFMPGVPADSLAINVPLGQLDQAIVNIDTRIDVLETQTAGTVGSVANYGAGTELTIASGAVTLSGSYHTIDTEGDAALDYLDTISGSAGDVFMLKLSNAARLVTIRHLATNGNIILSPAANFAYVGTTQVVRGFHDGTYAYLFAPEYMAESIAQLADVKAQNTQGGASAAAWTQRVINTKISDPDVICSIQRLAFTSGGTYEVLDGDTITGATSGTTGVVFDVELTGGSWAAGTAAGNLWIYNTSGNFAGGGAENLNVGTNANVATIAANFVYNQIRVKAGTYRVNANAPAVACNSHQTRLYNITGAAVLITGTSERITAAAGGSRSFVQGRFTVIVPTTFELEHYTELVVGGFGLGYPMNVTVEVYSLITLIKEL